MGFLCENPKVDIVALADPYQPSLDAALKMAPKRQGFTMTTKTSGGQECRGSSCGNTSQHSLPDCSRCFRCRKTCILREDHRLHNGVEDVRQASRDRTNIFHWSAAPFRPSLYQGNEDGTRWCDR